MSTQQKYAKDRVGSEKRSGHPTASPPMLSDYPELRSVISLALDAVVSSFYPQIIDEPFRAYLERVTVPATVAIYAPIAAMAAQAGRAAQESHAARTAGVADAAEKLAVCVADVAAAVQVRDDESAVIVARDASIAANLVADSETLRGDSAARALAAVAVAAAVHDAAAAAVQERAEAASLVAQAAIDAAAKVAESADAMTIAVDLQVYRAAAALQGIVLETCYHFAINVAASAAEAVLADGMPG